MVDENGQWLWGVLTDLLPYDILLRIVAVKPSVTGLIKDFPRWLSSSNGQLTVRDGGYSKSALLQIGWLHVRLQPERSSRGEVRWQCPPMGWHKLNTDGAMCGASGMATCGGILHTDVGGWVLGFSKRIRICSALEAEL
ncbi:hypothetical protein V6N11_060492 [Hibiscus sabdariffa]|uniref:RNase H type-1 domain-containing protein n=1 Tax=Hibiscus sabdariffa TaxID=183260 RepID=A0ABR2QQI5_9ROSI